MQDPDPVKKVQDLDPVRKVQDPDLHHCYYLSDTVKALNVNSINDTAGCGSGLFVWCRLQMIYTECSRSLDLLHIVTYCIKFVQTSWKHRM